MFIQMERSLELVRHAGLDFDRVIGFLTPSSLIEASLMHESSCEYPELITVQDIRVLCAVPAL